MNYCKCADYGQGQYEDDEGRTICDRCNQPVYDVVGLLLEIKESNERIEKWISYLRKPITFGTEPISGTACFFCPTCGSPIKKTGVAP